MVAASVGFTIAMNEELTFDALHSALARCMAAHPPEGLERSLHPDANTLATLWGLMAYQRSRSVPVADVDQEVLVVYERWAGPPEVQR